MLSLLCRQFTSAVTVRAMSTMTATAAAPETVQVLKLNMLQDNPGAGKKVREYLSLWECVNRRHQCRNRKNRQNPAANIIFIWLCYPSHP
jgi:hypothetical protein